MPVTVKDRAYPYAPKWILEIIERKKMLNTSFKPHKAAQIIMLLSILIASSFVAAHSPDEPVTSTGKAPISKQTTLQDDSPTSMQLRSSQRGKTIDTVKVTEPREISAEQLKQYVDKKTRFLLIDGRGIDYYQETIIGAIPIMEREVESKRGLLPSDKKTKIVAFCAGNGCEASKRICQKLMEYGYTNTEYYFGGFPDWKARGYPTEVPRQ